MTRQPHSTDPRDVYVSKKRAVTAVDGVPTHQFSDLDSETPPPVDVSAMAAYNHASNVQRRTANMLMRIAQSSGVGMTLADEVAEIREIATGARDLGTATDKKLRKWQAVAMSAIVAAGGSMVGVAKGLYSRGEEEGANAQVVRQLDTEVQRLRAQLDSVRDKIADMPRFPRLWDNQNTKDK